jgi:hypothetical protein
MPRSIKSPTPLSLLLLLVAGSCTHSSAGSPTPSRSAAGRVETPEAKPSVTTVLKGTNSLMRNPIQEIVRDSGRWAALRDSIYQFRERGIESPSLDFQHDLLIVVAGPPGAPGDSTIISRVTPSPQGLQIDVLVYKGCMPGQIRTMPFHVVRVSHWQEAPVFRERILRGPYCRS